MRVHRSTGRPCDHPSDPLRVALRDRCKFTFDRSSVPFHNEDGSVRLPEQGFTAEEGQATCPHGLTVKDDWNSITSAQLQEAVV